MNKRSKRVITVNGIQITMIRVEIDNDALDQNIKVSEPYYIAETPVTQELWKAVMGYRRFAFYGSKNPADSVSWNECEAFIKKLNSLTHRHFRFPTEVEWEFAARGGLKSKNYKYSGSDLLTNVAWYKDNSNLIAFDLDEDLDEYSNELLFETHEVAQKYSNELGIYDMCGNVWEWCSDIHGSSNYDNLANSTISNGNQHIVKGGGYLSESCCCEINRREVRFYDDKFDDQGLRLALSE